MKSLLTLTLITTFSTAAWAAYEQEFERSLAIWKKYPISDDLTYTFTTSYESWVGFGQTTSVQVKGETVVQRVFEAWQWYYDYEDGNTYKRKTIKNWVEGPNEIGQHREGEQAKTLDQVYHACRDQVLSLDDQRYVIDFTIDDAGLIKSCRARDIYCADDCWEGINIIDLKIHEH